MMNSAPAARAATSAHTPRIPGPRIATMSPGAVFGNVAPQRTPAPIGLKRVAVTGSRASGTFNSMLSGLRYWYWA